MGHPLFRPSDSSKHVPPFCFHPFLARMADHTYKQIWTPLACYTFVIHYMYIHIKIHTKILMAICLHYLHSYSTSTSIWMSASNCTVTLHPLLSINSLYYLNLFHKHFGSDITWKQHLFCVYVTGFPWCYSCSCSPKPARSTECRGCRHGKSLAFMWCVYHW